MTESPFTYAFDARDYGDAKDRVEAWYADTHTILLTAIATLRTQVDDFTGESMETV
jgi:hypothetical protein